jgi:hypothetical protein
MKRQAIKMLNVAHLFHRRVIFQRNNRAHYCIYPTLAQIQIFCRRKNRTFAFASIYEQPLPLSHYYEIGDLPIVASDAQTIRRVVQELPVKREQRLLCPTSAVWG